MDKKLCIKCRYCRNWGYNYGQISNYECTHPDLASPVDGSPINCSKARIGIQCGPNGVLWEPRPRSRLDKIIQGIDDLLHGCGGMG